MKIFFNRHTFDWGVSGFGMIRAPADPEDCRKDVSKTQSIGY